MDVSKLDVNEAFTYLHYNVNNSIKPGGKVSVEWFFKGLTKDQIAKDEKGKYAVFPGCGCTAEVEVTDKGIVAVYSDTTTTNILRTSSDGKYSVSKNIRVFLDDGNPLYERNDRGVLRPNYHGKKNVILTFTVEIAK